MFIKSFKNCLYFLIFFSSFIGAYEVDLLNSNDLFKYDSAIPEFNSSYTTEKTTPISTDRLNQSNQLFNSVKSLLAGNSQGLEAKIKSKLTSQGVGVTKSFLEKYFPTVEVSYTTGLYNKPTTGVLVLAPLSDINDIKNTIFTQLSAFYRDNRTTVNIGIGYRRLEFENKLLLGANLFYDHEFPYDHQRTSIGLEARTSVGEVNFNQYWGISGWIDGKNNLKERALGGTDIEIGIPLPYMNWIKFYGRAFVWDAVDGVNDIKGNDLSLQASLGGWNLAVGKRSYNTLTDNDFIQVSYNFIHSDKKEKMEWFSNSPYKLTSMEDKRFAKVRRENLIIKQTKSSGNIEVVTY